MRRTTFPAILLAVVTSVAGAEPRATPDLRAEGAFGFPQERAVVLVDAEALRVLATNDDEHLVVQAVLWSDGDDEPGETSDGRAIGDRSNLRLDVDADGAATRDIDRDYSLDPWPYLAGLHYAVILGEGMTTGLQSDSKGRGSITYHELPGGHVVRVDTYAVPLAEIGREPGDTIRIAFHAASPHPELIVNSVGFEKDGTYYAHHLPREDFHELELAAGEPAIDVAAIPEGRESQVPAAKTPRRPMPTIGQTPPDLVAEEWINTDGPLTLADLAGDVVVVEFWATWCGPCVANIPHLNELHERYADDGLHILSFTDQSRRGIENFLAERTMHYVVGTGSELFRTYGVTGIPHAFVIDRSGTLRWHGHPGTPAFEQQIKAALEADG